MDGLSSGDAYQAPATAESDKSNPEPPTEAALTRAGALPRGRVAIFFVLATVGAVADLWTKSAIFSRRGIPGEKDTWWIIDGMFGIETAVNTGAVFGLGAGMGVAFAAFSVIAGIGILVWLFHFKAAHSLWLTVALGMVSGGIIGNLYDRLGLWWQEGYPAAWKSGVRDWILVRFEGVPFFDPWPNFNIADSLLVVGAGMLFYQSLFPGEATNPDESVDPDDVTSQNDGAGPNRTLK